ncbi:hypothetical protein [Rufibacter sp. DG15C]|uniref:hypothetical protein n=1 Tax=Rufibacter sp. DG15C TaxID=1379909 RepID=UPI0012FA37CC|nr:hypothetical protein [Rufibacter sp. DG15C]
MIPLVHFLCSDLAGRADFLLTHGRFLMLRTEQEQTVRLYWTRHFLVEVYSSKTYHKTEKITAVTDTSALEGYVAHVNVNQLLPH